MSKIPSTPGDFVFRVVSNQTVYIEWEIHTFFDKTYVDNQYFDSPTFSLSDAEWFIRFFPNHNNNGFLYFKKKISPKDVRVRVTIGIKRGKDSAFKSFYTNRLFEKNQCEWLPPAFPSSELLRWKKDAVAPKGVLTIFLRACNLDGFPEDVAVEAACQTSSDGLETLSHNFNDLFLNGTHGDVTFVVQGMKFLAHKTVLSARSAVFKAMFETDMAENNEDIVDILDSDPGHFKSFLLHVYSGKIDMVSPGNALGLYMLADKYDFKELKSACSECIGREIEVDSFCDVAVLASLHGDITLMDNVNNFFIEHFSDIFPTAKWASFIAEHSQLANEILIQMGNRSKKGKAEA